MSSQPVFVTSISSSFCQAAQQTTTSIMAVVSLRRRSLSGGKIAGIVVAVLVFILFLAAYLLVRFVRSYVAQQERQRTENEFWHCRGTLEVLDSALSQRQVTEAFDVIPQQSQAQSPAAQSAIGSSRTARTMTIASQYDQEYARHDAQHVLGPPNAG